MNKEIIEFVWQTIILNDMIAIPLIIIINDIVENYKIVKKDKNDK